MKVSVVLPVLRAGPETVLGLLAALRRQTLPPDEILVVETCSDGPRLRGLAQDGVRHFVVAPEAFDHGGTRNLAVGAAEGDCVVFLTEDAFPADERLLARLIEPLSVPGIAASYGRHLPRPGAKPTERFARAFNYPAQPAVKGAAEVAALGIKAVFMSNVCAAWRKDAWRLAGGFPDRVLLSEDLVLAARLARLGYRIAYVPEARVLHSHDHTLARQFRRYFDIGAMLREHADALGIPTPGGEGRRFLRAQLAFLASSGHWPWIPYALLEAAVKYAGYRAGRHGRFLPAPLKARLSLRPLFWRRPAIASERRLQPAGS